MNTTTPSTATAAPAAKHSPGAFGITVLNGKTFITTLPFGDSEGRLQLAEVTGIKGRTRKNALLFAASPELLSSLKDLLAWANLDYSTNPATVALREKCEFAIKLATEE